MGLSRVYSCTSNRSGANSTPGTDRLHSEFYLCYSSFREKQLKRSISLYVAPTCTNVFTMCLHVYLTVIYRMKLQHFIVPSGPCVKDWILRRGEPIIISYYMSVFALAGRVLLLCIIHVLLLFPDRRSAKCGLAGWVCCCVRVLLLFPDRRSAECSLAGRVCCCVHVLLLFPDRRSAECGLAGMVCCCVRVLLLFPDGKSAECGLAGMVCCCVRVLFLFPDRRSALCGLASGICCCVRVLWFFPDRLFIKSLHIIVSLSCSCRLSRSIFSRIHAMATGEHCLVIFVELFQKLEIYVCIIL